MRFKLKSVNASVRSGEIYEFLVFSRITSTVSRCSRSRKFSVHATTKKSFRVTIALEKVFVFKDFGMKV